MDWEIGDADAVSAAFAGAAHRVSLTVRNNRVAVSPLEPRAAIASYDAVGDVLTLISPSQGVYGVRDQLAEHVFKLSPEKFRVITPDTGGGFGARFFANREQIAIAWAARRIGRPVRWLADRNECFTLDGHGRDHINTGELALDDQGRFLALRVSNIANMGAYVVGWGTSIPTDISCEVLTGAYAIPAAHANVKCVFTNMVQIDAYRGTGRAETIYLLERLVDAAARELGLPPDEIRRRNLIRPEQLPYTTPVGQTYDSGDLPCTLETALDRADWSGVAARQKRALLGGRHVGIGLSFYVMSAAGIFDEKARAKLDPDGRVSIFVGTQSTGQGHASVYAEIAAKCLSIPADTIRVAQGDTATCPHGAGTGQSRSLLMGGLAVRGAAKALLDAMRTFAGQLFQCDPGTVEYGAGAFRVSGTEQQLKLAELAQEAQDTAERDTPAKAALGALDVFFTASEAPMTFPYGCHVCEVAVDKDTGTVGILNYTSVDDFGVLFSQALCEGQLHGGTAQGIGQALLEKVVYEEGSGQLLTGSLMDYCLPRADDLPDFQIAFNEGTLCLTNPLGIKGAGEAGAIAAPAAVINAIIDALQPLSVSHVDMPATCETLWRAMNEAEGQS